MNKPDHIYQVNEYLCYQYRGRSWPQNKEQYVQIKTLQRSRTVVTGIVIFNAPSECLPPALDAPIKSRNTINSNFIEKIISIRGWYKPNNNITDYKDADTNQSPNVKKASGIFLSPRDDDMVQHISLINKSGPQEILAL